MITMRRWTSGCLLEISGQTESVFGQGSGETPISADSAEDEEMNSEKANGKAPEISPEEETAAGSSRNVSVESVRKARQSGAIRPKPTGYPGEGPTNIGVSDISEHAMTWVSDKRLDDEAAKKLEVSSTLNDVGYLGLVSESHPGGMEAEDIATSQVLRALWWKGFRAGQRGLCRAGGFEKGVRKPNLLKKEGWNPGVKKSFLRKPKIRGLMVHGSEVEGKPITENQGHHEGFPGGSSEQPMISTLSGEGSSQYNGNGQLERGEADRLERRRRGCPEGRWWEECFS